MSARRNAPLTPWRLGCWIFTLVVLTIFGGAALYARRAQAQIVVNGPAAERTFTVAEVNAALTLQVRADQQVLDAAMKLQQEQHKRELKEIGIAAREYVQRELATGCQGQT